jgi:lysophospholipase L1-like esterase
MLIFGLYLAIVYRYMYHYTMVLHPTKMFPPGNKFILTNEAITDPKMKLVCVVLGDSSSSGQGANAQTESYSYQYLEKYLLPRYREIYLYNLAESGAKTADVIAKQLEPTIALYPDLIMIAVGGNDLIQRHSRQSFMDNYRCILEKLKILDVPIIVLNIPAFNCTPILFEPIRSFLHWRAHYYNQGLAEVAKEFERVQVVDIYAIQDDGSCERAEIFSEDKFHLAGAGYRLWANQIANFYRS